MFYIGNYKKFFVGFKLKTVIKKHGLCCYKNNRSYSEINYNIKEVSVDFTGTICS